MRGARWALCVVLVCTGALCCPRRAHSLATFAPADPGSLRGALPQEARRPALACLRAALPRPGRTPAMRALRGAGGGDAGAGAPAAAVACAAARGGTLDGPEARAASLLRQLHGELAPLVAEERQDALPGERAALQQRVGALAQSAIALFRSQLQLARRQRLREQRARGDEHGVGGSRGLLILFEGLDRSGKGTQVQMLASALEVVPTCTFLLVR